MAALLSNATQRAAHAQALVNLVTSNGYDGIDLDYEAMNFGGTPAERQAVRGDGHGHEADRKQEPRIAAD